MPTEFAVRIDGREARATEAMTVAGAIAAAGVAACRTSVNGEPRGPLCGMGICFECRVTVNAVPHVRACQIKCEPGMDIRTGVPDEVPHICPPRADVGPRTSTFDVLVIGGGPAGLAAAARAAQAGVRVGIVDDNPAFGGQIWRGESAGKAAPWHQGATRDNIEALPGARVFDQPAPGVLLAECGDRVFELRYGKLILATGARERFLPFPGWTLPNVMGAGGLQAMVKSGAPIAGKRVVIAGSGPLLLAVAAYLQEHGARVLMIAEQAPAARVRRFAAALLFRFPGKVAQAVRLRMSLAGVPYRRGCWPIEAKGDDALRSVRLRHASGSEEDVACDYLACGFGLAPNTELAVLLGCELQDGFVKVDKLQCTSISNVYCTGETTSIGGLELSLLEGQIAGFAASGQEHRARALFSQRESFARFAALLDQTFALRDELKSLATDDTLVCRCEDVGFGRARRYSNWRSAKLQTRCGMGPCQGRVCGPALEFMLGWKPESVRPPVFPARVESLAHAAQDHT